MPAPPSWAREGGMLSPLTAATHDYEAEVLGDGDSFNTGMGRLSPSPERNEHMGSRAMFSHPGLGGGYSPPKMQPMPPVEPDREVVTIQTQNGGLIRVPFKVDMIGEDVKRHIEDTDGVGIVRQRLWLPDGSELDDFCQLQQVGVRGGDRLKLSVAASPRRFEAFNPPNLPESVLETREIHIPRETTDEPLEINFDRDMNVIGVNADGPAGKAGLTVDDRILEINNVKVHNVVDFRKALLDSNENVTLVVTKKSNLVPNSTDGEGAVNPLLVDSDMVDGGRSNIDGNCLWLIRRFCIGFSVFLAMVVGLVCLILEAAEGGRDCGHIEQWTIGTGVIYLVLGICTSVMLVNLYRNNKDIFDPSQLTTMSTLGAVSFLHLTILVTTIAGLVILSRDMSREERDNCSPFRNLVIFLVIAVSTAIILFVIVFLTICTYNRDVFERHQRYKAERAAAANLPSCRPQDYFLDRGNPHVPYAYV
eukprot:TRINITY_DN26370_c0_g1_i1.p1 TRINITY_DN26370_c0_g1~~TRINITY_DN26370_c0_g1_i1.p1  ORF type:complete len:492 (+),score=79.15 TRINITY_DN26370_c0_g1_i1:46-1476(+)